jgi:hypothetical protein
LCPRLLPSGPTLPFPLRWSWPANPLTQAHLPRFLRRATSQRTRKALFRHRMAPHRHSQNRQ